MTNINSQKPMSVTEAAEYCRLSKTYIYKLVHLGKIPYYKPTGGRLYFKQEELEQFIFRSHRAADYELTEGAEGETFGTFDLLNYL